MVDSRFKKLYKYENLYLAWKRINTSVTNLGYKNLYRKLFLYYETDIERNLKLLSERLKNGTYKFHTPLRFYKPKANGLQRPFTLLTVEDQIVYQAFANILIPEFYKKRNEFELNYVFSNIFNKDIATNEFLFKKWNYGYLKYKKRIENNFLSGNIYTAHFDLASYYDTIDHNSLTSALMKSGNNTFAIKLLEALKIWSNNSDARSKKVLHSIPQGPLASIVFAELFLLPIDECLVGNNICYSRYVDDIVIQGKSKNEVLQGIILLEQVCREKGLVPQSGKFQVYKAKNSQEAVGKQPSLSTERKKILFTDNNELKKEFDLLFTTDDIDSSSIRYILKSVKTSDILVDSVLQQFTEHFEFCEEFCIYLMNFIESKTSLYVSFFSNLLLNGSVPYSYVEFEIWKLLSYVNKIISISHSVIDFAVERYKSPQDDIKLGAAIFLSSCNIAFERFLERESKSLILLLLINYFDENTAINNIYPIYPRRKLHELLPILNACVFFNSLLKGEPSVIQLQEREIDDYKTIRYFLDEDYKIISTVDWKLFFKKDYHLAKQLMEGMHISKDAHKTAWLNLLDSFNDLLIRCLIEHLYSWDTSKIWNRIRDGGGKLIEYGNLINDTASFGRTYPNIADNFRCIHKLRCRTLFSHAKDKNTATPGKFINSVEQRKSIQEFIIGMNEVVNIIRSYTS